MSALEPPSGSTRKRSKRLVHPRKAYCRRDLPTIAQVIRLRSLRERITEPTAMTLIAILILAVYGVTRGLADPDFWWHLRAGQLIVANHHLLGTDPFTYTVSSHAWTMHEWLTEVCFAAMFALGGLTLIVVVLSLLSWLGVLLIAARARLDNPPNIITGVGMVVGLIASYPVWGPRAQMIDFTFSCLLLLMAEKHLCNGGRKIWFLVPLFLLWSNLHSGFVIGIAFLLVIVIAELAGWVLNWQGGASLRRVADLFGVAVAGTAAAAINPNGPSIILYPFATVGSNQQQNLIEEWHSPDFHDFIWRVGLEPMLLTLVVLLVINHRVRARDAALAAVTAVMALQSQRNVALFVAASTPLWINQANLAWQRLLTPRFAGRNSEAPPVLMASVTSAIVFAVSLGVGMYGLVKNATPGIDDIAYTNGQPVCAVRWLEASPVPLRIFNSYGKGGYLAYNLYSRGDRVFIFGDAALMGDQMLQNYSGIVSVNPDWDNIITQSGSQVLLFDTGTSLANVINASPRWSKLYSDPNTTIWARTGSSIARTLTMPVDANGARSGACLQASK
jgi:hypothetical protein